MARLDSQKNREWKHALSTTNAPFVAFGLALQGEGAVNPLEGMPGLADWNVHGQVSRLIVREQISSGESCLVPGDPARSRASYLFFPARGAGDAAAFTEKLRKLGANDVAIAESTFPEDFLVKVKQTLKKEGIRFSKLEPEDQRET